MPGKKMRHPLTKNEKAEGPRGSRMHLLDLLESGDARSTIDAELLKDTGFRLAEEPESRPRTRNYEDGAEYELELYLSEVAGDADSLPNDWWIPNRVRNARGPVWDLLALLSPKDTAEEGRPGLLMVEAKAHSSEFNPAKGMSEPSSSKESQDNADSIVRRITKTQSRLNSHNHTRIGLPFDHHYQLVNRLAYAVEMAHRGYDVVLMLLGFTEDEWFSDYFRNDNHFQREVGAYLHGIVPLWFPEQRHEFTNGQKTGSLRLVARSLPVINQTPPSKNAAD